MMIIFLHSFQSEWLKRKRSLASWLMIAGGFFVPIMMLIYRLHYIQISGAENSSPLVWEIVYGHYWPVMSALVIPSVVIMATSLVTGLEFKNNSWKLVHTLPQSLTTVYFSKLSVILLMIFQFFLFFNIGVVLTVLIPALFSGKVSFPAEAFPFLHILKVNCKYFIDCLPIIALQYLIGLQFRNLIVSISAGLGIFIASVMGLSWKYGYILPYIYCALFRDAAHHPNESQTYIHLWAIGYFIFFLVAGYLLYVTKKEKG
jgi:hypothetical protein